MNTISSIAAAPSKRYMRTEEARKARREYIKSNGNLVGKIRGAFSNTELYYAH